MSKNNERNAGRRAVIDGKYVTVKVTRKHIPTLKKFAKTLQELEPKTKKDENNNCK